MAFTLYIMQSVVLVALFRFIYPQWNLYFNKTNYLTLAAIVIVAQMILAYVYKSSGRQGPLEYFWRRLVAVKIKQVQKRHHRPESESEELTGVRHLRSHKVLSEINTESNK